MPPKHVIPVIFVPGIMGSNLRANGNLRHGIRTGHGNSDAYKFNCGFFDGHVELLGDLEGSNPKYWFPSGSIYNTNNGNNSIYNDVKVKYSLSGTVTIP